MPSLTDPRSQSSAFPPARDGDSFAPQGHTPFFLLLAIVAGFVVWIFSMPCFPTTDGPVHMYYVHVLGSLLAHNSPEYAHFFQIRHLLPPYSLYYYTLLLLSRAMPMLLADRVIICLYFISFVFGFRFLARQIGPSADLTTLLVTPLLLNWPLGMGFVNFCLSLSFSFWAVGLWMRLQGTDKVWGRAGFLLLVTGIMLTHPVPLLLLLLVAGALLFSRFVQAGNATHRLRMPAHGVADLLTLGLAALNVGYVKLFASGNPLKQINETGEAPLPYWTEFARRLTMYGREHAVAVLYGPHPDALLYRAALLLILVVPAALALRQRQQNRAVGVWTGGDTFLVLALGIFFFLPFVPSQLNGLYYFADRLVICVWLAFLFAASGWSGPSRHKATATSAHRWAGEGWPALPTRWMGACALFVVVVNAALLNAVDRDLRPAATAIARLDRDPPLVEGRVGFMMDDPRPFPGKVREGVFWNPYYWALAHAFRHNDAVLANAPWMHESIIPVAPSAALPEVQIAALREPFGNKLQRDLLRSPADLHQTLAADSFFLVNQVDRPALGSGEPLLLQQGADARDWTCTLQGWYRLCRQSASPSVLQAMRLESPPSGENR